MDERAYRTFRSMAHTLNPLVLLLLSSASFVQPFHVTRSTEIGLCTMTDGGNHPHKFSCLQGERNYCCGDRYNQTCCTIDQFTGEHQTSLTLITVALSVVGLLFLSVLILSLGTVSVSWNVQTKKKARNPL